MTLEENKFAQELQNQLPSLNGTNFEARVLMKKGTLIFEAVVRSLNQGRAALVTARGGSRVENSLPLALRKLQNELCPRSTVLIDTLVLKEVFAQAHEQQQLVELAENMFMAAFDSERTARFKADCLPYLLEFEAKTEIPYNTHVSMWFKVNEFFREARLSLVEEGDERFFDAFFNESPGSSTGLKYRSPRALQACAALNVFVEGAPLFDTLMVDVISKDKSRMPAGQSLTILSQDIFSKLFGIEGSTTTTTTTTTSSTSSSSSSTSSSSTSSTPTSTSTSSIEHTQNSDPKKIREAYVRDTLTALFLSGPKGVRSWNQTQQSNRLLSEFSGLACQDADLAGIFIAGHDFSNAVFDRAVLTNCMGSQANLSSTSFVGAKLNESYLSKIKAENANFTKANLTRSTLTGASLQNAKFENADITRTDFSEADLRGAQFISCKGISTAKFDQATFDESSKLPSDFSKGDKLVWKGSGQHPFSKPKSNSVALLADESAAAAKSSEEYQFISAIASNLLDDAPKLAYAEWLEKQADKRSTFVRQFLAATQNLTDDITFPDAGSFPKAWSNMLGLPLFEGLVEYDLVNVKELVLRLARPIVTITTGDPQTTVNEDRVPIGSSKFGGHPDLPAKVEWPACKNGRLGFLGQINLADLKATQAARALPKEGLLSFFAYQNGDNGYQPGVVEQVEADTQVLYTDSKKKLKRQQPPDDLDQSNYRGNGIQPVRQLAFCETWDFPAWQADDQGLPKAYAAAMKELEKAYIDAIHDSGMDSDDQSDEGDDQASDILLNRLYDSLSELRSKCNPEGLHLGCPGFGNFLMGYSVHSRTTEPSPGSDWTHLLCLCSDDNLCWNWCDGEHLAIFVHNDDLAGKTFARAYGYAS